MKADLHNHSYYSDGLLSPSELVRLASKANCDLFSLTDHDTTDGMAEARLEADKVDLNLINGVEISSFWRNMAIHIVGLGVDVDNDATIETLCKQGVILAESGVDIIAPSDMMDGRTGEIRKELDKNGFHKIPIFPYSVKYASSFYGPFRGAVSNSLDEGDRKTHQMSFKNSSEYLREIEQDINEGCDAVIIKPALSYLDIISKVKDRFSIPIIGYCVSGVYSMVKSASRENLIDEIDITMEILFSIKRAGATAIITYNAIEIAKKLNKE